MLCNLDLTLMSNCIRVSAPVYGSVGIGKRDFGAIADLTVAYVEKKGHGWSVARNHGFDGIC